MNFVKSETPFLNSIIIGKGSKQEEIPVDEINWIEASDHYVILHNHAKKHLIYETMKNLEIKLDPEKFIRVHRCSIVRISAIASHRTESTGDSYIYLKDSSKIKVSRGKIDNIDQLLSVSANDKSGKRES